MNIHCRIHGTLQKKTWPGTRDWKNRGSDATDATGCQPASARGHMGITLWMLLGLRWRAVILVFYPICSMYGIFIYIWVIYGVNVGKYYIHGASGYVYFQVLKVDLPMFIGLTWLTLDEPFRLVKYLHEIWRMLALHDQLCLCAGSPRHLGLALFGNSVNGHGF